MTFDETPPPSKTSPFMDDDLDEVEAIKVTEKKNLEKDIEDETLEIDEIVNIKESKNHPLENVIGNLNQRTLRSQISTIEPKNVNEALTDESWIIAMQEELNQFIANNGFAAALAVLVTGASQSRQHKSHHRFFPVDTSLIHIESRKSPTKSLIDVGSRRISIFTVNTKEYHSDVLAIITRIMRRT
ncbi:hypothetical protein Tco_1104977 [Tanacetum coccineum]